MESNIPRIAQLDEAEINEVLCRSSKKDFFVDGVSYYSVDEAIFLYPLTFWNDDAVRIVNEFIKKNKYHDILLTPIFLGSYREAIHFILLMEKKMSLKPEKVRILDVGTYLGMFISFMQGLGFENTYGIDQSSYAIAISKRIGVKNTSEGCFENMSTLFPKHSFDILLCMGVFDFPEAEQNSRGEEEAFIVNADTLLKPSGILIFRPKNTSVAVKEATTDFLRRHGYSIIICDTSGIIAQKSAMTGHA